MPKLFTKSDYVGKIYNSLEVVDAKRENGKTFFQCRCLACGSVAWYGADVVKRGKRKSCGCLPKIENIAGKRFGRLVAIEPIDEPPSKKVGGTKWHCKCDCGNVINVPIAYLKNGARRSCGCLNRETSRETAEKIKPIVQERHCKDGTYIPAITRKGLSSANTSGITGVRFDKSRGKWVAQLEFQKKNIYLGRFDEKEDAIKARKAAEKKYFQPVIDKYKK